MEEHYRHLIERFPERSDIIRTLAESNERFRDLLNDHHDVSVELSKMDQADREAESGKAGELSRRRASIEEELLLLMEGHQRM